MINETIPVADPATGALTHVSLVRAFLNPDLFVATGVDAIIGGELGAAHQAIDVYVVDAVRNLLTGLPLDLAALNIARGRETGVASLNDVRRFLHEHGTLLGDAGADITIGAQGDPRLRPYEGWDDFAEHLRDPSLIEQFKRVYRSVDDVDLWIGGLAEKADGGQLGSTFAYVFREQLDRLQDGDRFYYGNRLAGTDLLEDIKDQRFSDIVMRNTGLTGLGNDIFEVQELTAANFGERYVFNLTYTPPSAGDTLVFRSGTTPDTAGPNASRQWEAYVRSLDHWREAQAKMHGPDADPATTTTHYSWEGRGAHPGGSGTATYDNTFQAGGSPAALTAEGHDTITRLDEEDRIKINIAGAEDVADKLALLERFASVTNGYLGGDAGEADTLIDFGVSGGLLILDRQFASLAELHDAGSLVFG